MKRPPSKRRFFLHTKKNGEREKERDVYINHKIVLKSQYSSPPTRFIIIIDHKSSKSPIFIQI
jgi:hypothetical protein